jgi:hypothetical protein
MTKISLRSVIVIITAVAGSAFAQVHAPDTIWTRISPDSTWARDLCVTSDQDIVVLYENDSDSLPGPFVVRFNAQGDTIWQRFYGPSPMMLPTGICTAGDSGFFLTGYGGSNGTEVRKIDQNGDLVWRRLCVDSSALLDPYRICRSAEGGCAVLCERYSDNLAVLRYSETGDLLWYRRYNSRLGYPCGIFQTADGGYMLGARAYQDTVFDTQMYLLRIDAQGDSMWSRAIGGPGTESAESMSKTADGGVIFVGAFYPHGADIFWPPDAFAARVDSIGNLLWLKVMGGAMSDAFLSAVETSDGSFICGGSNRSDWPTGNLWIVGLTAQGDSLWSGGYWRYADAYTLNSMADGSTTICGAMLMPGYMKGLVMRIASPNFIHPGSPATSSTFHLDQNYPNPFNSVTQIEFTLPTTQRVYLRLYDVLGREVTVLVNEIKTAGEHRVSFDASGLASGVYLCRMEAGNFAQTRKLVLMK